MEPEEQKDFPLFLAEKVRAKGMNAKKIAELSGILELHIEHLMAGQYDALPPAPYVHGYLTRLGEVLDFNGEEWWLRLKEEGALVGSGPEDRLPANRFAKKRLPRFLWIVALLVVLGIYFAIRSAAILGTPMLIVTTPASTSATSSVNQFAIQGQVQDANTVTINGESIPIDTNGYFTKLILLEPGINTIEVAAKKFLGREKKGIYQISYEPPRAETSTPETEESTPQEESEAPLE